MPDSGDQPWFDRVVTAHKRVASSVSWNSQLGIPLLASLTFGVFVQVSHNNGLLPVYDLWTFRIGSALQSGLVPLLLAPIWVLYAYLQPLADELNADDPATKAAIVAARSLPYNFLHWGSIVAMFLLSSYMYLEGYPHWQCSATLAVLAAANWSAFDRTSQGAILGTLLLFGAPATEMFIVNVLHLWHYDRPDLFGVPHWAGWCYFAYGNGVGNFGRYVRELQNNKAGGMLKEE